MPTQRRTGRSILATLVGYVIVGVLVIVAFHFVVGTILWLFRTLVIVVVILALVTIYLRLKAPD